MLDCLFHIQKNLTQHRSAVCIRAASSGPAEWLFAENIGCWVGGAVGGQHETIMQTMILDLRDRLWKETMIRLN